MMKSLWDFHSGSHVTASPTSRQARQPIERRFDQSQAEGARDVLSEPRLAVNRDLARRQRGHLPAVNADDFPLCGDPSAPQQLGVVRLAGGKEQCWHHPSWLLLLFVFELDFAGRLKPRAVTQC